MIKNNNLVNNIYEVLLFMKRKKYQVRKIIIITIILIGIWILGVYLYDTYQKIEINEKKYETTRIQSTTNEQTVEKEEEKSQSIADMIEKETKKIVGISKLKNAGNSILSKNTASELGLGTGFIVTENGYIVSNEHVAGSKYSKCYVTLENGSTYNGTVVWSDADLDLAIIKIEAKNLPAVNLGDSNSIRVGETVYAIRKSYTDLNLEGQ